MNYETVLRDLKKSLYEMRFGDSPPSVHYIKIRIAKTRKIVCLISQDSNKLDFHFKKWDIISNLLDPLTSKIIDQFSNALHFIIVPHVRNQIRFYLCHYWQKSVMSLRWGHSALGCRDALWGLCLRSGTVGQGVCVPGGSHHGLSGWSRVL